MSTATIIDTYGQSYQLNPGVISIGPGKSNPIVLDNINGPDVVAELIYDGTRWVLKPCQDDIAVSLNGENLKQQRVLRHEDVIKIGDLVLRYMDNNSPLSQPTVDVNSNIASFRSTGEICTTTGPVMPAPQPPSLTMAQPGYLGVIAQAPPRTLAEAEQQRAWYYK